MIDQYILQISKKLLEKMDILELGQCLGIDDDTMESTFVKYPNDKTEATRKILRVWREEQETPKDVRVKLGNALVHCRKNLMAKTILNYPS